MSDKERGFDIAVALLENSRIGIRMALKVINLIVSGIGGNLSILAGASCKQVERLD